MRKILAVLIILLFTSAIPASAQMFDGSDGITIQEDKKEEQNEGDGITIQEDKKEEQKVEETKTPTTVERGSIFPADAYYYDKEKNRTYPQISSRKFAVMFEMPLDKKELTELVKPYKFIVNAYMLEDPSMLYYCVVFELDKGCDQDVFEILDVFNKLKIAKFASPVFVIDGKEQVFSGLFEMTVKENPDDPGQEDNSKTLYGMIALLEVSKKEVVEGRHNCLIYQVHLKEGGRNFFQIINFLAEDPRVVYAIPIFKSITPLVEIVQEVELKGARLGSKIPYKVIIKKDPRVKIDPSVLTNLKISQDNMVHKLDPYDSNKIIEGTEIVITGYVQFFTVGEQIIEPRKVAYILEENGQTVKGEVSSNPLVIKIASLVPENCEEGIIAKAPFKKYSAEKIITELKKNRNLALVLGLASMIICMIIIIKLSTRIADDMKIRKGKGTTNPLPEAVEGLKDAVSSIKDYDYAKRIDAAMRNWLSIKTGDDFRTGTVKNVKARLKELEDGLAEDASKVLEKCEEIMSREESDSQIQNLTLELEELTSKLVLDL